jgi:hypothetical protein
MFFDERAEAGVHRRRVPFPPRAESRLSNIAQKRFPHPFPLLVIEQSNAALVVDVLVSSQIAEHQRVESAPIEIIGQLSGQARQEDSVKLGILRQVVRER